MTSTEYRKLRPGAVVRTRVECTSRLVSIPRGTELVVEAKRNHRVNTIAATECECCHMRPVMNGIAYADVDVVRHAPSTNNQPGEPQP